MDPNYVDPGAPRTATQPPPPMPVRPVAPPPPPKPPPAPRKPRTPKASTAVASPAALPPAVVPRPAPSMFLDAASRVPRLPELWKVPINQRLAHLGIDVQRVAVAARNVETTSASTIKASRKRMNLPPHAAGTPAESAAVAAVDRARAEALAVQRTVRDFADRIVEFFGGAVHDPAMNVLGGSYRVESLAHRHLNGYHTWDGLVAVDKGRHAMMVRALERIAAGDMGAVTREEWGTIRTLVHETMHGHSPLAAAGYVKHGAAIEEATTELAARNVTREVFGTYGQGSYPDVIERLRLASGCSMTQLELASVLFHGPRPQGSPVSVTPDAHLRLFSRWLVAVRDGLATVPDAHNPQVDAMFNTLLPAMRKGP